MAKIKYRTRRCNAVIMHMCPMVQCRNPINTYFKYSFAFLVLIIMPFAAISIQRCNTNTSLSLCDEWKHYKSRATTTYNSKSAQSVCIHGYAVASFIKLYHTHIVSLPVSIIVCMYGMAFNVLFYYLCQLKCTINYVIIILNWWTHFFFFFLIFELINIYDFSHYGIL